MTTAVLVLAIVLAAVFGTLWRRSVLETRRAEASKLLAIAQVQIETDPTEALAYATASLELADNYEARVFTTRALSAGPPCPGTTMAENRLTSSRRPSRATVPGR